MCTEGTGEGEHGGRLYKKRRKLFPRLEDAVPRNDNTWTLGEKGRSPGKHDLGRSGESPLQGRFCRYRHTRVSRVAGLLLERRSWQWMVTWVEVLGDDQWTPRSLSQVLLSL